MASGHQHSRRRLFACRLFAAAAAHTFAATK